VGLDEALRQEGTAREIVSRVQQLRKKAALSPEDLVEVYYSCSDGSLLDVIKNHMDTIKETTRVELVAEEQMPARLRAKLIIENEEEINGLSFPPLSLPLPASSPRDPQLLRPAPPPRVANR